MSNTITTDGDFGTTGTRGTVGIGAPLPARQQRAHAGTREASGTNGTRESTEPPSEPAEPEVQTSEQGQENDGEQPAEMSIPAAGEVEPVSEPTSPEPARATVPLRARAGDKACRAVAAGRELFTPPDVVRHRRPTAVERLSYARHGDYTPPGGLWQWAQHAYGYVSAGIGMVLEVVNWWFERLARALVLLVTGLVIWPTPVGQAMASVLAWAARTWADLITL